MLLIFGVSLVLYFLGKLFQQFDTLIRYLTFSFFNLIKSTKRSVCKNLRFMSAWIYPSSCIKARNFKIGFIRAAALLSSIFRNSWLSAMYLSVPV